ncbi:hypothetical protein HMPREF9996_02382 [Aggregatibacter actinomycetemcomitans Y4]|nr:hypothetical protein HMPREF9996_02382 [Aggregatibacter actinomycetemcomitans Y4]KYK85620.1 hypothetical protein SA508_08780 [Aggregatibacter actinomycetemcomitans serotype d str. SA508]KYK93401.1 hypothetical protein SA269_03680 [Aggregatibacter actinomycetemcomitans serotype d str. SA269]
MVSSVWVIFILSIFVIYYEKLRGIIQQNMIQNQQNSLNALNV